MLIDALGAQSGEPPVAKAIDVLRAQTDLVGKAGLRLGQIVRSLKSFTHVDEAEFQLADIHVGIDSTLDLRRPSGVSAYGSSRKFGAIPRIEGFPSELNQAFYDSSGQRRGSDRRRRHARHHEGTRQWFRLRRARREKCLG